jgi:uncharacterized membrane protein
MTVIGIVHLIFSLLAILFGAVVVMLPKGTRWHRTWGHGYVWTMVGVVATALAMYNLTGRVTPFHFAAAAAGGTLLAGMWTVLRRRPRKAWILVHATWMSWSYVGLLAALVAESLTRWVMPALEGALDRSALWPAFWTLVALGSLAAIGVGAWLIRTRLPAAVAGTPAAMRSERDELAVARE